MSSLEQRFDTTLPRRTAAHPRAAALALVLAGQLAMLLHPCGAATIAHADSSGFVTSKPAIAGWERAEGRGHGGVIAAAASEDHLSVRWNALLVAAHDTTATKSALTMREPRDLSLFASPTVSRRTRWFLWATSAVAVGAVIAVFAQPHDVDRSRRPDLPEFPDAP